MVAEYFLPQDNTKNTINHIDGDKTNNNVNNLEWANLSEQMQHAYSLGLKKPVRGTMQGSSVLTESQVREIRKLYTPHSKQYGMRALAKKYNVSESVINKVAHYRAYLNVE